MHTPERQDVPLSWQMHTCTMQAEVFISTEWCALKSTSSSCVSSAQAPPAPQPCCAGRARVRRDDLTPQALQWPLRLCVRQEPAACACRHG